MDVPDAFWNGEQKLLWQAAHTEEIFKSFPTIYLSMADSDDDTQEFCLAIVPQVLWLRRIKTLTYHNCNSYLYDRSFTSCERIPILLSFSST